MPFRYAICNETFGDMPVEDALRLAKDAGYTGWEVAPFMLSDDISSFSKSERRTYRDLMTDAEMQCVGLHWLLAKTEGYHLTTRDAITRASTTAYLCDLAELCADLGGKVMVLGSPQQRNRTEGQSIDEAMENAAEVLRGVVPALHSHGVRIALEPLGPAEGDFLNTADEGVRLAEMIDDDHIGLHLDVKAMSSESKPIETVIREHADSMIHFHANDPNLLGPGMGDVPFQPIMQALSDIDYDGWVSVEVFDYSPGAETLARESIANLKSSIG
ncbi:MULTISPECIES: sugar phosphate isomerase/epimerase family protein [Rhodopirellula]|uniref:Xylose isomerase domain protein TIM barrel n=1 Tax=Rhodopirellula europaea 6C TaxID=1263867 RepID=M2A825_9BACT|nr:MULTISPECIES: sugar phosphate isomerase/epimerase family protein [Rhodopirellula]EMB17781.1 Xylose isomerase domain protein TIM barrel [Rhodopirellula europaea 6C]